MAFKVVFPANTNMVTVSGLFQWDYGQTLEIEDNSLGSEVVEVHFACTNMSEAIVRSCSFSNGVGTVTIPDHCLEQATTITAWVYRIKDTTGYTYKTINLPIAARTRPSKVREIPQEIVDKYTELITEVNEAVENLESGNVTAAKANYAQNANYASSAGNASNANYATSAGNANTANSSNSAKYIHPDIQNAVDSTEYIIYEPGIYCVLLENNTARHSEFIYVPAGAFDTGKEVVGNYVKFHRYSNVSGALIPCNDSGNIRSVMVLTNFAAG